MAETEKGIRVYIDLEVNKAKTEASRQKLEDELTAQLAQDVPDMVSRLTELDSIVALEVGETFRFIKEATEAYKFGLWRSVIALVGIAAECFVNDLYNQFHEIAFGGGAQLSKEALFGKNDDIDETRKITVLYALGHITERDNRELLRIREIIHQYTYPTGNALIAANDARESFKSLRRIIKDRFDRFYAIEQGKIVKRHQKE